MENRESSSTRGWWLYAIFLTKNGVPDHVLHSTDHVSTVGQWSLYIGLLIVAVCGAMVSWFSPGGCAWAAARHKKAIAIPGPKGWPVIGSLMDLSVGLAHRNLEYLARLHGAKKIMAFSLGSTPAVITSDPGVARDLLSSPHFADRPLKQSAQQLMFGRAMGFAPNGDYWRLLRRISATHLFSPRRIGAHEVGRQVDCTTMLSDIRDESDINGGAVTLRRHLQKAALNNMMGSVFGRWSVDAETEKNLREMVNEGFELLGAFNWADHLPWLRVLDPLRIHSRCARLVPRVTSFVKNIIDDHRQRNETADSDFVDVLLSLRGDEKLDDDDMIAVLWEMIFRGTDTTALLTEWAMAELLLNPQVQSKLQGELDAVVGRNRSVTEADIEKLPYLQAVVKESLRMHPPGPLLSWARLCTEDWFMANGMCVTAGTTAMVNMWSITHDPEIWDRPHQFRPERFLPSEGGQHVDVRGNDLRLAPFGAGRRVCPGKALGLRTVQLWVAKLFHSFTWVPSPNHPVDLTEKLKLSCEMATPLTAIPVSRIPLPST
eukprot:PITA_15893